MESDVGHLSIYLVAQLTCPTRRPQILDEGVAIGERLQLVWYMDPKKNLDLEGVGAVLMEETVYLR